MAIPVISVIGSDSIKEWLEMTRVTKSSGDPVVDYQRMLLKLEDLAGAPAHGTNKDGATVVANVVKFREFIFKDADTCEQYHFWIPCTEPVKKV